MSEIVNRVAQSSLITFDLEEYYPEGQRVVLDISTWLHEGLILKEKEFRQQVEQHDWTQYQDAFVAVKCSTDAIIPAWAFMLITSKLQPFARLVMQGEITDIDTQLYADIIRDLDISQFKDKPVIIKGCSDKPVPPNAYIWATEKIQTVARSVMYGEACSSVPLFKRK